MTSYSIEVVSQDGDRNYIAVSANSDAAARKLTAKYASENQGKQVFCAFSRRADGQHGYINRSGAGFTGHAY